MLALIVSCLKDAAILVSLFTLVGNLVQKKSVNELIVSTIKTYIGFLMLMAGAKLFIAPVLKNFSTIFQMAFQIEGVVPNNEVIIVAAMDAFGSNFASAIAYGLIFAMLLNLILARITPLKYIVLSGHHVFFMVSCLTLICILNNYSLLTSTIIATVITAFWCIISPALLVGYCSRIKNCDDLRKSGPFSIGQFGSTSYMLAGWLGDKFGNVKNDAEELKIPTSIGFLKDKNISTFVIMFVFFLISALVAGFDQIQELANGNHKSHEEVSVFLYLVKQSALFSIGIYVLTSGVHMFIDELIPAFNGIASKIIKKSIPAVEIYTLFAYSNNAVFIGFIMCSISCFITMVVVTLFGFPVIIPSLLFTFASGGGSGIIGNATGGLRGAIIGSIACGIISTIGSAMIYKPINEVFIRETGTSTNSTYSTTDFTVLGNSLNYILKIIN